VVDGALYVVGGGDVFWGKNDCWLQCADAGGSGDVTQEARRWSYPLRQHTLSTPAVADGLVYVSDTGKTVHCVEAATGEPCWTQACGGAFWASPLVADGKVYIGSRSGDFWILAAGRERRVLLETELPAPVSATATAANGVLYVATMTHLYAIDAPN
jgi:outer membrane protein assembly factor BamB